MSGVPAGRFREIVSIEARAAGQDARGQPNGAWGPLLTDIRADAEPLKGREFFAAGQTQSEIAVRFTIRFRAGVVETQRVMWRGAPHEIVSVIPGRLRDELELMCMHGVRDGR